MGRQKTVSQLMADTYMLTAVSGKEKSNKCSMFAKSDICTVGAEDPFSQRVHFTPTFSGFVH